MEYGEVKTNSAVKQIRLQANFVAVDSLRVITGGSSVNPVMRWSKPPLFISL